MFEVSVIDYLGKVENGILVLLYILYNNIHYEATFYYTDKDILLTVSDDLEIILGHKITENSNYINLLKDRKYLRPDQYNVWEGVECDSECFVNPKTIITTIQGVLNVN